VLLKVEGNSTLPFRRDTHILSFFDWLLYLFASSDRLPCLAPPLYFHGSWFCKPPLPFSSCHFSCLFARLSFHCVPPNSVKKLFALIILCFFRADVTYFLLLDLFHQFLPTGFLTRCILIRRFFSPVFLIYNPPLHRLFSPPPPPSFWADCIDPIGLSLSWPFFCFIGEGGLKVFLFFLAAHPFFYFSSSPVVFFTQNVVLIWGIKLFFFFFFLAFVPDAPFWSFDHSAVLFIELCRFLGFFQSCHSFPHELLRRFFFQSVVAGAVFFFFFVSQTRLPPPLPITFFYFFQHPLLFFPEDWVP